MQRFDQFADGHHPLVLPYAPVQRSYDFD
jgi:hypothetical protein